MKDYILYPQHNLFYLSGRLGPLHGMQEHREEHGPLGEM